MRNEPWGALGSFTAAPTFTTISMGTQNFMRILSAPVVAGVAVRVSGLCESLGVGLRAPSSRCARQKLADVRRRHSEVCRIVEVAAVMETNRTATGHIEEGTEPELPPRVELS